LAYHTMQNPDQLGHFVQPIQVEGGSLSIKYQVDIKGQYTQIWLCGHAVRVYQGVFELTL
jgi:hypothetical protein